MAEEKINKKYGIRKILKEVIENELKNAEVIMKEEVDDLKYEILESIAEVLKRKTAAIKELEKEIVELETNTENMSQIINDGTHFKMYCKKKLNTLHKFLGQNIGRGHNDNVTKRVNTVNLPKLEISQFNGNPTKWQSFFDSFQAAVGKSTNLSGKEKFNYLRNLLEGDALHAIARFSLTNDNNKEALELLQSRYGNTQQIIAAHINALVKMSSVNNEDLRGLRKFFDDVTSHVRSLVNLGVESRTYGSLLCPVILEKLSNGLRLTIS